MAWSRPPRVPIGSMTSPPSVSRAGNPAVRTHILAYLGRELRSDYEPLVRAPVPENLAWLVDRLEKKGNGRSKGTRKR
jgi:hypothetical protein